MVHMEPAMEYKVQSFSNLPSKLGKPCIARRPTVHPRPKVLILSTPMSYFAQNDHLSRPHAARRWSFLEVRECIAEPLEKDNHHATHTRPLDLGHRVYNELQSCWNMGLPDKDSWAAQIPLLPKRKYRAIVLNASATRFWLPAWWRNTIGYSWRKESHWACRLLSFFWAPRNFNASWSEKRRNSLWIR